jgi:hypothetical protein
VVTAAGTRPRDVTDDEVSFYRHHGWVLLPALVGADFAEELRQRIEEHDARAVQSLTRPAHVAAAWRNYQLRDVDPLFHAFSRSPEVGRVGSRLQDDRPMRFWAEEAMVKMPAAGEGGPTPWHADQPYFPHDRGHALTIWIALTELPPEQGTLRFLSGAHREGLVGRALGDAERDLKVQRPELWRRYEESPPLHLHAGDATVHCAMTPHRAPANETSAPRWVYSVSVFPADTLYTGAPQAFTDGLGLAVNEPFDHPRFPLL